MKRSKIFGLLFAIAVVAAACGDDGESTAEGSGDASCDPLPTKTEGVLTVATGEPAFPPWVENDDPSSEEGFESAVVYAVAAELGVDTVEWTRTGFDEAIVAGEKDFDFNIQQYSITDERDQIVDFSTGYYQVEQALVAAADGPAAGASSVADLVDLKLGAATSTTSLNYIEDVIQPATPAAVYDDNSAAVAAFNAGQIDAIVFDLPTAYFITAVELPEAAIVGVLPRQGDPEELGMLFEEGSALVGCVNEALATLRDNGTLESIEETWLNQSGAIPTLES